MRRFSGGQICAIALVMALAGCAEEEPAEDVFTEDAPAVEAPAEEPLDEAGEVGVGDIVAEGAQYEGRTVTVVADVEEVFGPRMFALDEDAALEGGVDDDLLVLSPQAGSLAEIDDQWLDNRVRVTGTVRGVTVVELESDIGWDLDPEMETELEGRDVVLVATSVERVDG